MKFLIKDDPISYDEIYQAINVYMRENHGKQPEYAIVHPETRGNLILSVLDEKNKSLRYSVITQDFNKKEELRSSEKLMGIDILVSKSVEPGFLLICG
jgi:hypothetical protein